MGQGMNLPKQVRPSPTRLGGQSSQSKAGMSDAGELSVHSTPVKQGDVAQESKSTSQ